MRRLLGKSSKSSLLCVLGFVLFAPAPAKATRAVAGPILEEGDVSAIAVAGARLSRDHRNLAGYESVRFGIGEWLELLLPGAAKVPVVRFDEGSALLLGLGVSRLSWTDDGRVLLHLTGAAAAHLRLGAEAGLLAAFEVTTKAVGAHSDGRPLYGRTGAVLSIDFGPYLTVSAGVAYQTELFDSLEENDLGRRGAHHGPSRVSFGGVFQEPVGSRPTLAFHIGRNVDFLIDLRLDVDTDIRASSTSLLGGFSVSTSPP